MGNGFLPAGDPSTWKAAQVAELLSRIAVWLLTLAGAVAVIFIIWGGINYITAFGDEAKAEEGKKTLTWAIIGLVFIILSRLIIWTVWQWVGGVDPAFPTTTPGFN